MYVPIAIISCPFSSRSRWPTWRSSLRRRWPSWARPRGCWAASGPSSTRRRRTSRSRWVLKNKVAQGGSRWASVPVVLSSKPESRCKADFFSFSVSGSGSLPPSPADSGVSDVDPSSSSHNSDDENRIHRQRHSNLSGKLQRLVASWAEVFKQSTAHIR